MIKRAKVEDIEEIYYIEREVFLNPFKKDEILNDLKQSYAYYYMYFIDNNIVGYIGAYKVLDEVQIISVGILKEYRKKGFAKELLNIFIEDESVKILSLEVSVKNESAINLYSSLGFLKVGIRKGYYVEAKEDAYNMLLIKEIDENISY